jgi:hypothetical protein
MGNVSWGRMFFGLHPDTFKADPGKLAEEALDKV